MLQGKSGFWGLGFSGVGFRVRVNGNIGIKMLNYQHYGPRFIV